MDYKISKERKVELVKEILELIQVGKRQKDIEKIMIDKYLDTDFLDKQGYPSEDEAHKLVALTWSKYSSKLTAQQKEELKQLRKQNTLSINEEKNKMMVEEIKQKIAYYYNPSYITNMFSSVAKKRKALDDAIKFVSHYEAISVSSITKRLIEGDPEFYEYFNCDFNEEYALKLVNYVVSKKGSKIMVRTYPSYQKSLELVEEKYPELFAKYKEIIGENVRTYALTQNTYKIDSGSTFKTQDLVAIALEYHISIEELLDFVRTNNDYFNNGSFIPNNIEFIKSLLRGEEPYQFGESISFYLYEEENCQDNGALNPERFNELKNYFIVCKDYGNRKTEIDKRTDITTNMAMRKSLEEYSKEETINVARFMYKFALTEEQLNMELLTSGITIDSLISNLVKYGEETLYLVKGLYNLKNYQLNREQEKSLSR